MIAALAPVFLLVALGWGLARLRVLGPEAERGLNGLLYWVALPVQLLVAVGGADLRTAFSPAAFAAAALAFAAGLGLGWALTARAEPAQRGALINGMARANGAFVGLPIVVLLAGVVGGPAGSALHAAYAVLLAGMVPLFNLGAVFAFVLPQHGPGRAGLAAVARELPRNPIILGCAGGIALALVAPGLLQDPPAPLAPLIAALDLLAGAAIPLALLLTGARLDFALLLAARRWLVLVVAVKLLAVPGLTLALCLAFGAPLAATQAAVILNACPAAMAAVAMARALGGDDRLLAAAIVATTAASPLTLAGWLWLLERL